MPGIKFHTKRRRKKKPPTRQKKVTGMAVTVLQVSTSSSGTATPGSSSPTTPPDTPVPGDPSSVPVSAGSLTATVPGGSPTAAVPGGSPTAAVPGDSPNSSNDSDCLPETASEKKLKLSPFYSSGGECVGDNEGNDVRLYESVGLQQALLEGTRCSKCRRGRIVLKEDESMQQGLFVAPYLFCAKCKNHTPILFKRAGKEGRGIALNQKAILASKCAGQSYAAFKMMFSMLGLCHRQCTQHMSRKSNCTS